MPFDGLSPWDAFFSLLPIEIVQDPLSPLTRQPSVSLGVMCEDKGDLVLLAMYSTAPQVGRVEGHLGEQDLSRGPWLDGVLVVG